MRCLEFQNLVQRRLDGEGIALSHELEQHRVECASCRSLLAGAQILLKGLALLPAPMCPPDFCQRMTGLVMEDRRIRRRRVRLRLFVTGALAASILLTALAGYFLSPLPRNLEAAPEEVANAKKEAPEVDPVVKPEETPHVAKTVTDARHAFAALSERWAEKAKEQTKIFLSAANPIEFAEIDTLPDVAEPLELGPAAQSLRQAGQEVVGSLQPVSTTARRAFAYFVRELPVLERKN